MYECSEVSHLLETWQAHLEQDEKRVHREAWLQIGCCQLLIRVTYFVSSHSQLWIEYENIFDWAVDVVAVYRNVR